MPPELLSEGRLSKAADVCKYLCCNPHSLPLVSLQSGNGAPSYLLTNPLSVADAFGVLLWEMYTGEPQSCSA